MATNREQEDFDTLYTKFVNAVRQINLSLQAGRNPWIAKEIARFRQEIETPMDELWQAFSDHQKTEFWNREHNE